MQTILLTDFEMISRIYNLHMKKDFPANELKPLAIIRKAWERGIYDCYGMFDGQDVISYAFFNKLPMEESFCCLLDYLAVADGFRGREYGTLLLKQLAEIMQDVDFVVVEVEDPDKAADEQERKIRERRLQFYLRNGYRETGITARVFGVDYRLLETTGGEHYEKKISGGKTQSAEDPVCGVYHSEKEIRDIYAALYKSMLPAQMFKAFIRFT